jgi:endonuclease G, mitochondrial
MQQFTQFIKSIFDWLIETLNQLLSEYQKQQGGAQAPSNEPQDKQTEPDEPEPESEPAPRRSKGGLEIDQNYKAKKGFNRRFLSITLPFPELAPRWARSVVEFNEFNNEKAIELKYHHFSVVMNVERKMPFFTAVNIDGDSYNALKDQVPTRKEIGPDKWFLDPRIAPAQQIAASFYKGNDFDIGHIVRREDALWGDTLEFALKANNDTFHLTNACPQHKDFNRNAIRWLGLEDYALKNARKYGLKISVYSGPVFRKNDMVFAGVKIPASFWKVIVMIKDDGTPSATGYMIQQDDLIKDMERNEFVYGQFKVYQIPISEIEGLTGISFFLNNYDPLQKGKRKGLVYQPQTVDDYDTIEL